MTHVTNSMFSRNLFAKMPSSRYLFEEGKFLVDEFLKMFKKAKISGYAEMKCDHVETVGAKLTMSLFSNEFKEVLLTEATFCLNSYADLVTASHFLQDFVSVRGQNADDTDDESQSREFKFLVWTLAQHVLLFCV